MSFHEICEHDFSGLDGVPTNNLLHCCRCGIRKIDAERLAALQRDRNECMAILSMALYDNAESGEHTEITLASEAAKRIAALEILLNEVWSEGRCSDALHIRLMQALAGGKDTSVATVNQIGPIGGWKVGGKERT